MPPIRTIPIARPVRTERTHEENQERAYIAASRRSDRSLEARVESARRASEIHKKRTGRSLRVREEDVMNEEMYEEEDDDLPMQFRRINALHPGLAYTALNERVNNYLASQIGMRHYLHQAIYQANQSQYANQFMNPMLHSHLFPPGPISPSTAMNAPFTHQDQTSDTTAAAAAWPAPAPHARATSVATPQGLSHYYQQSAAFDARRMSVPIERMKSPSAGHAPPLSPRSQRNVPSHMSSPSASGQKMSPGNALQPAGRPLSESDSTAADQQLYPLTTKLPPEVQQLMDGSPAFAHAVHPSQLNPGLFMPSMAIYNYHAPTKPKDVTDGNMATGLHQTLSQYNMYGHHSMSSPESEPFSAVSAPATLDCSFNGNFFGGLEPYPDPNNTFQFDLDLTSSSDIGAAQNSGQVTPNPDGTWNETDFFNYAAASA